MRRSGEYRRTEAQRLFDRLTSPKCARRWRSGNLQDRRKPAIQLDKEPAIIVREPDATWQPTPHDIQLMSKHRVPSFKPQLRLEWRGQDGQNETEQPDHSASLGDSITTSTRIRFSVHTPGCPCTEGRYDRLAHAISIKKHNYAGGLACLVPFKSATGQARSSGSVRFWQRKPDIEVISTLISSYPLLELPQSCS